MVASLDLFFFDGAVNGENYLEMLNNVVLPYLRQREDFNELFFQQDGAPPHYALNVRTFLPQTSRRHFSAKICFCRGRVPTLMRVQRSMLNNILSDNIKLYLIIPEKNAL